MVAPFASSEVLTRIHDSDYKAEVSSAFSAPVLGGFLPVQLRLENRSDREQTFSLLCESSVYNVADSSYSFMRNYSVPPQSTSVIDELLPAARQLPDPAFARHAHVSYSGYTNLNLQGTLMAPGSSENFFMHWSDSSGIGNAAIVATSQGAYSRFESSSGRSGAAPTHAASSSEAITIELGEAPADWRAYWGLDTVFLLRSEWKQLSPERRQALQMFAAAGGKVVAYSDVMPSAFSAAADAVSRAPAGTLLPRGLGLIAVMDEAAFDKAVVALGVGASESVGSWLRQRDLSGYTDFSDRSYLGYQIAVIAFILCIGPINLSLLCRPPNRLRLFFTTPLIAAAFCVFAFSYAFFRDGVGGKGHRFALSVFLPESKSLLEFQGQVADTGLLFDESFELPDGALIQKVDALGGASVEQSDRIALRRGVYSGDWFRSRWAQGHLIAQQISTRERILIEIDPDGKSVWARSEINATLDDFYYTDAKGGLWKADRLELGERVALQSVLTGHIPAMGDWSELLAQRIYSVGSPRNRTPNTFLARMRDAARPEIDTLPSIEWRSASRFAYGEASLLSGDKNGGGQ